MATDGLFIGPECSFTGPDSGAEPGLCTETPGYISNTEINNIINNSSISSTTALDDLSNSNILIWDDNWVAYMDDENKAARMAAYQALNFLGTSDWAVDLQDLESSTGLVLTELSTSSSSTQICKMTYTTSGAKTTLQDAGSIASSTWSASGAGLYLDEVLQTNGTAGWLLGFFETVVDCGASPGGTVYDCSDIMSSTCEEPKSCDTYCPSQAYFVHYSIWQFFHFYQQFKLNIQGMALVEIATTINIISDTFAPPDTSASELYSILGGVLTTLAGLGTFVGDFELDALGAASDGLAAFAAMFADTALGGDDEDDTTEELDEILGSTLESVFGAVNKTINTVLNPGYDADISMIESFFTGGAFLDYQVVDWSIKAVTAAFNNTMVGVLCNPLSHMNANSSDRTHISS